MTEAEEILIAPVESVEATEPAETLQAAPAAPTLALVKGQAVMDMPKDLYIPPDAMQVLLDAFEGPLDFLLYLIRKQNIDILDIPIADVTRQYMEYIDLMQDLSLELAAEYLVMAAILAEIKSRMLLPRVVDAQNEEQDPRAELVRRLQEYERYKQAAENFEHLPREDRDTFLVTADSSEISVEKPQPNVSMQEILRALMEVMKRADLSTNHHIRLDALSVREKMTLILDNLQQQEHCLFTNLFDPKEGRLGVVVTFLAMLELLKQGMIEFVQASAFAPIYLQPKAVMAHASPLLEEVEVEAEDV
jgi:segregation and condensation protein A